MRTIAHQSLLRCQDGQTMAEYAVVLGTIVLAVVAVIGLLSDAIVSRFGSVATTVSELLPS